MKVALVGNPNSGKTSLYNRLAGVREKTGNFSGVTVDRRSTQLDVEGTAIELVDLPGTYTLFSTAPDEQVVFEELLNPEFKPDVVVAVIDKTMLRRSLSLLTQLLDLNLNCIVAFNMNEAAEKVGINLDLQLFNQELGVDSVEVNARTGENVDRLKKAIIQQTRPQGKSVVNDFIFEKLQQKPSKNTEAYLTFLKQTVEEIQRGNAHTHLAIHKEEIIARYGFIDALLNTVKKEPVASSKKERVFGVDKWVVHNFWGYVILMAILFVVFQAVYSLSSYPMDLIDGGVASLCEFLSTVLPEGPLTSLLLDGVIAGLGGVVIFIPQIAFLFIILSFLEESGYMVRVIYLMDSIMTKFGMSGRSIVPLVSASACAIPAVMAARSIDNWKERIITIMVAPFISCSARLPVYAVLIALAVPDIDYGIFNLKGIAFFGLYMLGIVAAVGSGYLMKVFFKPTESSFLMMEFPEYRWPQFGRIALNTFEKTSSFVLGAGKIILAISIVLWGLASFGPNMERAEESAIREATIQGFNDEETQQLVASYKLEASYAGILGKSIEPAIRPLGYDWKIGIALITSFAAREVFVGTLATIYSVGEEDEGTLLEKMRAQKYPGTDVYVYSVATSFSLLVFYVFAMQCMSTLAIVKRETGTWTWPLVQFGYMSALAYISALVVYQVLK